MIVIQKPELMDQLAGPKPYWRYHPRVKDHPGPSVVVGCLNWGSSQELKRIGKRVIGVDPQTSNVPDGFEIIEGAVAPFRGTAELHGHDGGASMFWFHRPVIATVKLITMDDVLKQTGEMASLQMNCEGMEALTLITMRQPYADQMTIGFHDRPGGGPNGVGFGEPILQSARDAIINHLASWYDCVRLTAWTKDDWWFFLRRN